MYGSGAKLWARQALPFAPSVCFWRRCHQIVVPYAWLDLWAKGFIQQARFHLFSRNKKSNIELFQLKGILSLLHSFDPH
jgi:hypothetical protein